MAISYRNTRYFPAKSLHYGVIENCNFTSIIRGGETSELHNTSVPKLYGRLKVSFPAISLDFNPFFPPAIFSHILQLSQVFV